MPLRHLPILLAFSIAAASANSPPPPNASKEELEKWFADDSNTSAKEVNEGELTFLDKPPTGKPIHHHQNKITLSTASMGEGWAKLEQCHDNLDAVPALQITFREGYVKDLQVTEQRNIGKAWVEGASIQLKDVGKEGRLCLSAQSRALRPAGKGKFTLLNGPYMRKFLDGYYPMRVSMRVEYPAELLKVAHTVPASQNGFAITQQDGVLTYDTVFEGELRTAIHFERR